MTGGKIEGVSNIEYGNIKNSNIKKTGTLKKSGELKFKMPQYRLSGTTKIPHYRFDVLVFNVPVFPQKIAIDSVFTLSTTMEHYLRMNQTCLPGFLNKDTFFVF
jgi:hypothetical protein